MSVVHPYRLMAWDPDWRVWQRVAHYIRLADAFDAYSDVVTAPGNRWVAVVLVDGGQARILRHNVPADLPPDLFQSEATAG